MKGFEQYDLRAWLDNGLSYHPEPVKPMSSQVHRASKFLTKIAIPLMTLGAAGVVQAAAVAQSLASPPGFQATAHAVGHDQRLVAVQSQSLILAPARGVASPLSVLDELTTRRQLCWLKSAGAP